MEAQRLVLSNITSTPLNQTSNLDQLLHQIHDALKKVVYAGKLLRRPPRSTNGNVPLPVLCGPERFDPPPQPQKVSPVTCMAYVFRTARSCSIPQSEFDRLAAEGEVELVGSASPAPLARRSTGKHPTPPSASWSSSTTRTPAPTTSATWNFLDSVGGGHIALAIDRVRAEEASPQERVHVPLALLPHAASHVGF